MLNNTLFLKPASLLMTISCVASRTNLRAVSSRVLHSIQTGLLPGQLTMSDQDYDNALLFELLNGPL